VIKLRDKLLDPFLPVTLFEMVPPAADKPASADTALAGLQKVRRMVDAINLPEIHDETRGGTARTVKFVPRVEPRSLGARIQRELDVPVVVNRCVVYEPDQTRWFRGTFQDFGVDHFVLVGGESSQVTYPGPSVLEAANQLRTAELPISAGGISIPSRAQEADRIRRKNAAGLSFFTTQVLFDSNDIVWLIQRLHGVEARVFLSFAPVSHARDLEFLRWLGADIPADLDRFLLHSPNGSAPSPEVCWARSLDLAQRILMDVFDNLPPDPPLIGLNVEHINQRNFRPAIRMLEHLGNLYANLWVAHARV